MDYKIDGTDVNTRIDWRHNITPGGPQAQVMNQFPGIPEIFMINGPAMPHQFTLIGLIDKSDADFDEAHKLLLEQILAYGDMMSDQSAHNITVGTHVFNNCVLIKFEPNGKVNGVLDPDTPTNSKMLRGVVFTWQQLVRD